MEKSVSGVRKQGAELASLRKSASQLRGAMSDADAEEASQRLRSCEEALSRVQSIAPSTGSLFVRLFLGQVNVRVASSKEKEVLRDEYEKFRFRTNFGFIVFPAAWLFTQLYLRFKWQYTHWIYILTHVWLLYYYVSLALRINILKVVRVRRRPPPPHAPLQPLPRGAHSRTPRSLARRTGLPSSPGGSITTTCQR